MDFKFAAGYHVRLLVEAKLSTNHKLIAGYERQLKAYSESQEPIRATYLVIDVGGLTRKRRAQLVALRDEHKPSAPEIVFVDGTKQQSASKR